MAAKGIERLPDLIKIAGQAPQELLPDMVRSVLSGFIRAIAAVNDEIALMAKRLQAWHRTSAQSQRLAGIPGVGPIGATAFAALVPDPTLFKNGRHLAAWLGLTPGRTRREARRGFRASQRQAMAICAACSCLAPPRFCAICKTSRPPLRFGRKRCWQGGPSGW